jgi:hypothetical protein
VYGVVFAEEKGLRSLYQLAFIPAALYGGTFALVGLAWLFGRGPAGSAVAARPAASPAAATARRRPRTARKP